MAATLKSFMSSILKYITGQYRAECQWGTKQNGTEMKLKAHARV